MAKQSRDSVKGHMREQDKVVIGNWDDETFLEGEVYDVILADYLIGAMDGFSPYTQDLIFERLKVTRKSHQYFGPSTLIPNSYSYPQSAI
mmetsp:Transcript_8452/g.24433  ORF Transcript_8452/g.24433 Transcript_8452/m.24433 type:complete len:90 (+) Transcript_8452:522-791(+)